MAHLIRIVASTILMFLVASASLGAKGVTLTGAQNGTVIGLEGSIGMDGEYGMAVGTGFSIAGVLDLGLTFGADLVPDQGSLTSDIGMAYSVAPLKQSVAVPVSMQVYGAWTFRAQTSDFLERNRLLQEARGYRLGVALMHDLGLGSAVAFRLGALAEYRNYRRTTTVGFDTTEFAGTGEVDYATYPRVERVGGFEYGGYVGIMVRTAGVGGFLAGASVLTNPDLSLRIRPDLQVLISR